MSRLLLVFFIFVLSIPRIEAAVLKINLQQAIILAQKVNQEIVVKKLEEQVAETDRERAVGEYWPKLKSFAAVAPVYKESGNALISTEDKTSKGRAFFSEIDITQPIYTWGRISNYVEAATYGTKVKQAETLQKSLEISYQVKEAYWSALYAASLLDFIRDGKQDLEKVKKDLEKNKASKRDLDRLEIFSQTITAKEAEVTNALNLAHEALALRMGADPSDTITLEEAWLSEYEQNLKPLDYYLVQAKRNRAEFAMLHDGIAAQTALSHAESKANYPFFAMGVRANFADTNVKQAQQSSFAYDPYNRDSIAFGVGIKWDLDWQVQKAKAAKHVAEANVLQAQLAFAEQGIPVEVKRAYGDLVEAKTRLEAMRNVYRVGKRWLSRELMTVGAGLGNSKDLVEAYEAKAKSVKDYYEAIYRYNMAWASLAKVVALEL